jgi:hypothetical protein
MDAPTRRELRVIGYRILLSNAACFVVGLVIGRLTA